MVLNYVGYSVIKNILVNQIVIVFLIYSSGLKGDLNDGFVGDMVNGLGFGVYYGLIYQLVKIYVGDKVFDLIGKSIFVVYEQFEKGNFVWVIIIFNFMLVNNMQIWKILNGMIDIMYSEYSVVVMGYDEIYVYFNDLYGYKNRKIDRISFEKVWEQMGSQVVVI